MKYRYRAKRSKFKEVAKVQKSGSGEDLDLILEKLRRIANNKTVIATVFIVVGIFALYSMTTAVTGYYAYQEDLENELNQTKQDLANAKALQEQCKKDLTTCSSEKVTYLTELSDTKGFLEACEEDRDDYKREWNDCKDEIDAMNDDLNECEEDRDEYEDKWDDCRDDKEALQNDYNSLRNNYIEDKCCAGFPGQTIYWKLSGQEILCATNQTSGYSSYNCP